MQTPFQLSQLIEYTQAAGQILLERFNTDIEVGLKGAEEVVTESDRASEAFLLDKLTTLFPGSGFFGEETGYHASRNGYTWVVDPLDGTHNYSVGIPCWGCSVALLDGEGYPVMGVLDFPTENRVLWSEVGKGAFHNGQRLVVDSTPLHGNSIIGVQSRIRLNPFPDHVQKVAYHYCARSLGSIAYNGALVARAKMRACTDLKVKLYDIAAVSLILMESGGFVSDLDGNPIFPIQAEMSSFVGYPTPFFGGDAVTGPELLKFLFPEGTPQALREDIEALKKQH